MTKQLDYYFVAGDNMDDVISGYRTLTGKAPIMPKWAMGFWQSREKYNTSDEMLGALKGFRDRQIPIDNIVLDWNHWRKMPGEVMNSTRTVSLILRLWSTPFMPCTDV